MWWKICKLLVALVLIALLMLIFVNLKQQNTNADVEKKTKLAEEIQNNGRSELIESREMYLPIEDNETRKQMQGKVFKRRQSQKWIQIGIPSKHFMPVRYDMPNMTRKRYMPRCQMILMRSRRYQKEIEV